VASRSPEEIRASIEQNRQELGNSLEKLRREVVQVTDWRSQLRRRKTPAMIGAAVAGFMIGGGLAALGTLAFGRDD
jgi:hypothetical protein